VASNVQAEIAREGGLFCFWYEEWKSGKWEVEGHCLRRQSPLLSGLQEGKKKKKKEEEKKIFSELFCHSAGPLQALSSPIMETTSSENSRAVWVLLAEKFKPREGLV
jgi:hypothetical protein